jgi:hypothetical protein
MVFKYTEEKCKYFRVPRDGEVCDLDNPFQAMFEYQDDCVEATQPYVPYLYNFIMHAGDIYRSVSQGYPLDETNFYIAEKLDKLDRVRYISEWEEKSVVLNLLRKDNDAKRHLKYLDRISDWKRFTKEFPKCSDEKRREVQLASVDIIEKLTKWGLYLRSTIDLSREELKEYDTNIPDITLPNVEEITTEKIKKEVQRYREIFSDVPLNPANL